MKTEELCDFPRIKIVGRGRVKIVDYDMNPTGERLSRLAFQELCRFTKGYQQVNGIRPKRRHTCNPTSGEIEVLPEHAEEIAARVLIYITDPSVHDPNLAAKVALLEDLRSRQHEKGGYSFDSKLPRELRWNGIHKEAVKKYPNFKDNPLDDFPGRQIEDTKKETA